MPELTVKINGDISGLTGAVNSAKGSLGGLGSGLTNLPLGQIGLAVGALTALGKVSIDVVKAGQDAKVAQEAFAKSLEQAGAASEGWEQSTNDAIGAAQALAFTDDDARKAISTLATATGDLDTSLGYLPGVMDIAAASGTDLATASDAVGKALNGSDRALRALVEGLPAAETSIGTLDAAILQSAGQADIMSQSVDAMGKKADIVFSELMETVGVEVLPLLEKLGTALQPFIDALLELAQAVWPILKPVLAAMFDFLASVVSIIADLVSGITGLITWISDLIKKVQEGLDWLAKLDPFAKDPNAKFFNAETGEWYGPGARSAPTGRSGGTQPTTGIMPPMTFNIYGDPSVIEARVTKALRDYSRRNGPGAIFQPGRR
jgi:hypothetical protein